MFFITCLGGLIFILNTKYQSLLIFQIYAYLYANSLSQFITNIPFSHYKLYHTPSKINKSIKLHLKRISLKLIHIMSTGPFTRTNRNTPQRNLNKSQQPTQASFTPSQPSTVADQQTKAGYVYKPPTKIARSNVNTVKETTKVEEKIEVKRQEPTKQAQLIKKIQQPPVQKPASFARKPATEITKETTTVRATTVRTQVSETKEEVKPVAVKSVSKLPIVRTNDPSSISAVRTPRKQEKQETPKVQQAPTKQITSPYTRTKPTVQQKPQVKPPTIAKNPLQQLTQDPTKTIPNLQIKKQSPSYSYPKKISRRQSQKQSQAQIQVKQQSKQVIEQPKPNTPKFSENDNTQTPQMFSSTYAYRGKNANSQVSVQSSQSSTTLKKEYQSVVHTPVEKVVQTQKPASTIMETPVKSPGKSPLSHASRYSNKVETPVREEKVVDNNNTQQQPLRQPVKRSPILGYALNRLYMHKMTTHLQQFVQYTKNIKQTKANEKIHQYFQRSLIKFVKIYEHNVLMRSSFGLMKSVFSKLVKLDMTKSTDPKVANQLTVNRNQTFGKVLENIIPSVIMELRFSFIKLKSNLNEQKNLQVKRETGVRILSGVEFRKMRENFQLLIDWLKAKNQSKLWKLSRCSQINSSYKKWLIFQSWTKLISHKLKQTSAQSKTTSQPKTLTTRPSLTKLTQKPSIQPQQAQANLQLKQKVSELQVKLSQVQQQNAQVPKESDLRKALQQLKQQKGQISQEIALKKQRGIQLKQRLQSIMSKASHQQLSSLSQQKKQQQQPTLTLLHQIYMNLYKQPQHQCTSEQNLTSLWTIHRVEQNTKSKQIVAKWLAIQENMELKHWINLYEGNCVEEAGEEGIVGQRKWANKQMEEENQLVKKFIRSYVKERYMWQEVKGYVQAVVGE